MTKFAIFMYLCAAMPNLECKMIKTEFNSFKDEYECVHYGYKYVDTLNLHIMNDGSGNLVGCMCR